MAVPTLDEGYSLNVAGMSPGANNGNTTSEASDCSQACQAIMASVAQDLKPDEACQAAPTNLSGIRHKA